ncbi:MAG: sulfatase-like hydrolase/transferase [Planctomycetes bacterium]|nr:sulfatase-like hydrolase/transferase [Planctomycetota bacterium]
MRVGCNEGAAAGVQSGTGGALALHFGSLTRPVCPLGRARGTAMMRSAMLWMLVAMALVVGSARGADKPMNFVIILVDDMGWMDLSVQGSQFYRTPNVDKLAADGLRFTQAYASCAVCSPTRAAMQTGREPARLGVTDWIRSQFQGGKTGDVIPTDYIGSPHDKLLCPPNPFAMQLSEVTIAEALKTKGYATCHIGKWHLGTEAFYPDKQGYDLNIGGCDYGQPPTYFDPYIRGKQNGFPTMPARKAGEYLTDREADEAVKFIKDHKDGPFFLNMDHYAVHEPLGAKKEMIDEYEGKSWGKQKNATYAAMVESVDQAAGKILAALDEAGVADRTLVIFTSDNGGLLGPTNNEPLRAGKGFPYEGGIREPLIIRWPGVIKPGTLSQQMVQTIDFYPTICQLAGVSVDHPIDGISLVDHLRSSGSSPLKRDALYWHFPHYRGKGIPPYSIIREGDFKLIKFWEGPTFELFNLADDLSEKNNLASKMPDKVRAMDAKLMAHLKDEGAKLPRPNPNYKG